MWTIPDDVVILVLAKTIPIDQLAVEMRWIDFSHLEDPRQTGAIKAEEHRTSMYKRQSQWQNGLKKGEHFTLSLVGPFC